jgi:hypothetical protein
MSLQTYRPIIGGPAILTYRGATFRSKGDIVLDTTLGTFPIETDILSQVDERVSERPIRLRFTPEGAWDNLSILYQFFEYNSFGDLACPQRILGSIGANQCHVSNHLLLPGDAVVPMVQGSGTITTGLSAGTLVYVHPVDPDTLTFHTTRADALVGTNNIAISAGTGTTIISVNNPLTIQSVDGELYTFYNAAVVQPPGIRVTTVNTLFSEMTFEAFIREGYDWTTDGALYSLVANPWPGDTGEDPTLILTQPTQAAWLATAPWDNFNTKNGWDINFATTWSEVMVDNFGTINRRYSNLIVTARAIPTGITSSDVASAIKLQGTGADRGRSLGTSGHNLDLTADGFFVRLYQAALRGGSGHYSPRTDRIGELTWLATRSFSNGTPNPLFYLGTTSIT